jgi:SanA protein
MQQTEVGNAARMHSVEMDMYNSGTMTRPQPSPRRWRRWLLLSGGVALVMAGAVLLPFLWQSWVNDRYGASIYSVADAPSQRVGIVFGARVYPSGRLSGMLRDRVETGVALYQAGKVEKLLMTGDNSRADYNEPDAMKAHAVSLGVPAADIQVDYGGRRTYDSCYRARDIFQVSSAILVTQSFHLPRALYLCDQLGLPAVGVASDISRYDPRSVAWSETREIPALLGALVDVVRRAPPPVMGDPIPIE